MEVVLVPTRDFLRSACRRRSAPIRTPDWKRRSSQHASMVLESLEASRKPDNQDHIPPGRLGGGSSAGGHSGSPQTCTGVEGHQTNGCNSNSVMNPSGSSGCCCLAGRLRCRRTEDALCSRSVSSFKFSVTPFSDVATVL